MSHDNNYYSEAPSDSQGCDSLSSCDEQSQPLPEASGRQLRPAGKSISRMPPEWNADTSDDDNRAIEYNVEWKLSINKRRQAGQSELGVSQSPRRFWRDVLKPELAAQNAKKPCRADETQIVLSTTHRRTSKITKCYPKLDVNWSFIEKQLQKWAKLPQTGKDANIITLNITLNCSYVDVSKPPRGTATANQTEELEARTGDGNVLSRGVCIRKAYKLMECTGPPCRKSDHCWVYQNEHYPLHPHHIKMLADHLQAGRPLNGHDDVPETFRRLVLDDERDRKAREERDGRRKRRRRDLEGAATTLSHVNENAVSPPKLVFPAKRLMGYDKPREDLVRAYGVWQRPLVSKEQRGWLDMMQHLTLERGYDLDIIASNPEYMYYFFTEENDVPEGCAWSYVCDVRAFHELREEQHNYGL